MDFLEAPSPGRAVQARWLCLLLLIGWLATTAVVTLLPTGDAGPHSPLTILSVGNGPQYSADFILNWMMFLPGGVLATAVLGLNRGVAMTVGLTVLLEGLQVGVPGRHPALLDVMSNTLGALTGAVLLRDGLSVRIQRLIGVACGVAWLAPIVLLIPKTTSDDLFGLWTPSFGNAAHYRGQIFDASIGGLSVPSGLQHDKEALDDAIAARKRMKLRLTIARPPSKLAPIFQISDHEQEILMLGALGSDLILRGRNPARMLGLDQPDVRWSDALQGLSPGDTVTVVVERGRDSVCMSVASRTQCGLAPSLAGGWGHLLYVEGAPSWMRKLIGLLWALGLGVAIGAACSSPRGAAMAAITLAVAGYGLSRASPDVRPDLIGSGVLVVGGFVGAALRQPVARLWSWIRTARPAGPPRTSRPT